MLSRNTGGMADAMSCLLNERAVGTQLSHDVGARCRLEAFHDGLLCPVLMPSCPGPDETRQSRDALNGSAKAQEAPC